MNDQVEAVKSKVDIVEVIGQRVVLKKAGRHFKGLCPFHSEKSPSFIVSSERQSYKCFGCQEGGDVFSFLQKYDGMSFFEALETLAKKVGITLDSYRPTSQDAYRRKLLEIASLASEYYHFLLTKHESGSEARNYLKSRGISNESIGQFHLGYAPNSWRSVSDYLVNKKKYAPEDLEAVGLIIRKDSNNFYDRFRGRVIFPLKDHKGIVVGFSGRTLSKEPTEAKYINSPETQLYSKSKMLYGLWENREAIRKENAIILVEGELDVIPSWQAGVKNVVAIKGSAFTSEQAQLMTRFTKNVIMSLDSDSAGQEAIKRAVSIAENIDLSIRVIQITGGKDPGDVATASPKDWREMVKKSVLYWDFLIDSACANHDPKTGSGMNSITREVVPQIAGISNLVVRAHYVSELASKLKVPESAIYEEIERTRKKKELSVLKETVSKIEKGSMKRQDEVSLYLLSLALQNFDKLKAKFEKFEPEWMSVMSCAKIMEKLKTYQVKSGFNIAEFSKTIPEEMQEVIDQAYLRDLSSILEPEKEWDITEREVEEMYVRARLSKITQEIGVSERDKNESLPGLQAEFAKFSRRLSELS